MDEQESLNHTKWECKYHVVCFHSEMPPEDLVPGTAAVSWGSIPSVGRAEGESD